MQVTSEILPVRLRNFLLCRYCYSKIRARISQYGQEPSGSCDLLIHAHAQTVWGWSVPISCCHGHIRPRPFCKTSSALSVIHFGSESLVLSGVRKWHEAAHWIYWFKVDRVFTCFGGLKYSEVRSIQDSKVQIVNMEKDNNIYRGCNSLGYHIVMCRSLSMTCSKHYQSLRAVAL